MAAKKKSSKNKREPASSQPLADDAISSASLAKTALQKYLALPDAETIARHIRPANSAHEAVQLIQSAKFEAWQIRLTMARGWNSHTLAKVKEMLPETVRTIHPVIGPLMIAHHPQGNFDTMVENARIMLAQDDREKELREEEEKRAMRAADAKAALKAKHSKGGKVGTPRRESNVMIACVKSYVKWVKANEKAINIESSQQSPQAKGMTLERTRDLLGTFVNALARQTPNDEIVRLLNERHETRTQRKTQKQVKRYFFKNATLDAVTECMRILKSSIG